MNSKEKQKKHPACYGDLEKVFPMGQGGLRHTPEDCFACMHKTECLRMAVQGTEGLKLQEEHLDRAYDSGMISFLERWSKRKDLYRRRKKCL